MTRAIILASVLFLACDAADIASRATAALDDHTPPSAQAVECAHGQPRWAAPSVAYAIDCQKLERKRR